MKGLPIDEITLPNLKAADSVDSFPRDGIYFVRFDDNSLPGIAARINRRIFGMIAGDPAIELWNTAVNLPANRARPVDTRTFADTFPDPRFDDPPARQSIDVHRLFDQLIEHARVMRNG